MDTYTARELRLVTLHKLCPNMALWVWCAPVWNDEPKKPFAWYYQGDHWAVEQALEMIANGQTHGHRHYILDLSPSSDIPPTWIPPVGYDYDLG